MLLVLLLVTLVVAAVGAGAVVATLTFNELFS